MTQTRRILRLSGADTDTFLQGLITNDITHLGDGLLYAAILTPQGKLIADFFLKRDAGTILLDVAEPQTDMLQKRLTMYKLRADVTIDATDLHLQRGTGPAPANAQPDPRHPALGWRTYTTAPDSTDGTDFDAIRVAHCIPEWGAELSADTFILEARFEAINGVDFRKGCYVGQEVTARMKHKTELRKGFATVQITGGPVPHGTALIANGKPAGEIYTQSGTNAIAYLRFDRATGPMAASTATVIWPHP